MVSLERRVREETQGTLVRLIEELETNLSREIQAETDERVENEESFIQLLETTCARVESNMLQMWEQNGFSFVSLTHFF